MDNRTAGQCLEEGSSGVLRACVEWKGLQGSRGRWSWSRLLQHWLRLSSLFPFLQHFRILSEPPACRTKEDCPRLMSQEIGHIPAQTKTKVLRACVEWLAMHGSSWRRSWWGILQHWLRLSLVCSLLQHLWILSDQQEIRKKEDCRWLVSSEDSTLQHRGQLSCSAWRWGYSRLWPDTHPGLQRPDWLSGGWRLSIQVNLLIECFIKED